MAAIDSVDNIPIGGSMLRRGTLLGGRYRLEEPVASGGMSIVWRATDTVLSRTVAVKVLAPELLAQPNFVERFRSEAKTMAILDHSAVVNVHDFGKDADTVYIVMKYVDGESLHQRLRRVGTLSVRTTLWIIVQAGDALHAAHQKGIVHRDVKPGNLLIDRSGRLLLTDFGIALSSAMDRLTTTGAVLATAYYMAPEQVQRTEIGPATDVYALGVVAYECLSGAPPFRGDDLMQISLAHLHQPPPPLPDAVPPQVRRIVERALAKRPEHRFGSAADMTQAARAATAELKQSAAEPIPAAKPQYQRGTARPLNLRPRADPAETAWLPAGDEASQAIASNRRPLVNRAILITAVVAALAIGIGAVWASSRPGNTGPQPSASQQMPGDLRAFAPGLPFDEFDRKDVSNGQKEKWGRETDDPTGVSIFVIRYDGPAQRNNARDILPSDPPSSVTQSLQLRRGIAVSPPPARERGPYVECVVQLQVIYGAEIYAEIWWDNSGSQPQNSTALLLRTRLIPSPVDALKRLRTAWQEQKYQGP